MFFKFLKVFSASVLNIRLGVSFRLKVSFRVIVRVRVMVKFSVRFRVVLRINKSHLGKNFAVWRWG